MSFSTEHRWALFAGAAEWTTLMIPKGWKRDGSRYGIVYNHGAGQDARVPFLSTLTGQRQLLFGLAETYPILIGDLGGQHYGNATHTARFEAAQQYMATTLGCRAGGVHAIGTSMGGLGVLNWARTNKPAAKSVIGIESVSDLADLRAKPAFTALVDAAYGGAYSDATFGATSNPKVFAAADLAGLRYKAWYAADDTTVSQASVLDIVAKIGATASAVNVGNLGHSEAAVAAVPVADVLAFLAAGEA